MPQRARQSISTGLVQGRSSLAAFESPSVGGSALATGSYRLWALAPVNQQAVSGAATGPNAAYPGDALAASTTSKAQGIPNSPAAMLGAFWMFLTGAGGGASTVQLQLYSADAAGHLVGPVNLSAATAINGVAAGWTLVALTVPTERQWSKAGVLVPQECLLYPGDVLMVAVAGASTPAGTVLQADVI